VLFFPVSRPPQRRAPPKGACEACRQADEAEIRICDVVVTMTRRGNLCVPAEFSAIIPRAEIRRRYQDGQVSEEEIILSSITIVHSPRHRTDEEPGTVSGPPASQESATVSSIPVQAAPRPARQWDDNGTWSGVKMAAAEKCVPRVSINGCKRRLGEAAVKEAGPEAT